MGHPDLTRATAQLAAVVTGIRDDQLDGPTPCAGTSVAALLDHAAGLALAFTWAANKDVPADAGAGSADASALDPEWRTVIPQRLAVLAEAWRRPDSWTGMTAAGGVDLPGEVAGIVALDEVVVHGWDLARATGQAYEVDEADAEAIMGFVATFEGPTDGSLFGPPVAVPDDAPLFDRVLGLTGRDPGWSPS